MEREGSGASGIGRGWEKQRRANEEDGCTNGSEVVKM